MFKTFGLNKWYKHQIVFIVLGSIPGALLRWQINNDFWSNILGSAFLGFIVGLKLNQRVQLLLVIGLCGSLTTFSGWIFDSFDLILKGFLLHGLFLIIGTLIAGLFCLSVGFFVGQNLKSHFCSK